MITLEDQVFHLANFLIMGLSDRKGFISPKPFSAAIPIEIRPIPTHRTSSPMVCKIPQHKQAPRKLWTHGQTLLNDQRLPFLPPRSF
jgi:hypothetical protein